MKINKQEFDPRKCVYCGRDYIPTVKHQRSCGGDRCRTKQLRENSKKNYEAKKKNPALKKINQRPRGNQTISKEYENCALVNKFLLRKPTGEN